MQYIENKILPACTYNVVKRTSLHNEDRLTLTLLYQPIMGQLALSLYFTLWGDMEQSIITDEYTHHRLLCLMQTDLTQFVIARERLEALGLIRTYVGEKNGIETFVYELYAPVTPNDFFQNPILNELLFNYLGEITYKKTKDHFKIPKYRFNNYKEITKKLNEVFEFSSSELNYDLMHEEEFLGKNTSSIDLDYRGFDFDLFYASLPTTWISRNVLTQRDQDFILKLHQIYHVDAEAMKNLVLTSLTERGNLSHEQLRKQVRDWYSFENNGKKVQLVHRKQPVFLHAPLVDDSPKTRMIKRFENETPYQFLKNAYNGSEPLTRDLQIIETLMIETELNPGVINVLIDYVLLTNNHKLTKGYIESIASQWKIKQVQTVEEAIELAEKEHTKYFKNNPSTTKSSKSKGNEKEKLPEWFNKDIEKQEMDEESIAELQDLLKTLG